MKWTLPVFLCILLSGAGYGQSKSSIDIIGGLDYSYRNLELNSDEDIHRNILDSRNEGEVGKLNWRAGFNYNRFLGKKLFLRTGLRFASVGYKSKKITELRFGSQNDGNGGLIEDATLPMEVQYKYDHYFIELPIALRYELGKRKLKPFAELGIAPSFRLTERQLEYVEDDRFRQFTRNDYRNTNQVHLVGLGALGLNYTVNPKYEVFIQAIIRYHSPTFSDTFILENLYSMGGEFGVRRSLTKEPQEDNEVNLRF